MIEKIVEWIVGFSKLQIGFWLLVYEVTIYMSKGKLQSFFKSGLEKRIQLQYDLKNKIQLQHKGGEPKIILRQKFANASDFKLKIKKIDAVFKVQGKEIKRLHYDESDHIFPDKSELIFPDDICPLDLDKAVEYTINDITILAKIVPDYKQSSFFIDVEQAIEFATRTTTISKTVKVDVNIPPEDWKGVQR